MLGQKESNGKRESKHYLPCEVVLRRTHTDRPRVRRFEARYGEKPDVSDLHATLQLPDMLPRTDYLHFYTSITKFHMLSFSKYLFLDLPMNV